MNSVICCVYPSDMFFSIFVCNSFSVTFYEPFYMAKITAYVGQILAISSFLSAFCSVFITLVINSCKLTVQWFQGSTFSHPMFCVGIPVAQNLLLDDDPSCSSGSFMP